MYHIKIKDGHGEISGSAIRLRNKFVKKFPNLQVQENVIETIENLNKASVLDVFQFLMKSGASKKYLAQETHLEWAELTDDQAKQFGTKFVLKSIQISKSSLVEKFLTSVTVSWKSGPKEVLT